MPNPADRNPFGLPEDPPFLTGTGRLASKRSPDPYSLPFRSPSYTDKRTVGVDVASKTGDFSAFTIFELDTKGAPRPVEYDKMDYAAIEARILAFHARREWCLSDSILTGTTMNIPNPPPMSLEEMSRAIMKINGGRRKSTLISWSRQGPLVHAAGLMSREACVRQQRSFETLFGHTVVITPDLIESYGPLFDGSWFLEQLFADEWIKFGDMAKIYSCYPMTDWKKRPADECRGIWRGILWVLWQGNAWREMLYDPAIWAQRPRPRVVSTDAC